jgi:hypothetical protein
LRAINPAAATANQYAPLRCVGLLKGLDGHENKIGTEAHTVNGPRQLLSWRLQPQYACIFAVSETKIGEV